MNIRTFSGVHDWHDSVLNDTDADKMAADRIIESVESGRCPRCERPLPQPFPAGSRITRCRSIPICSECGSDEAEQCARRGLSLSPASRWPINRDEIDNRREAGAANAADTLMLNLERSIVTGSRVIPVMPPQNNTGGWAQYGLPPVG